jgi:hypothetical protein
MDIAHFNDSFPFIVIKNLYDEHELNLIWEELNFLCYSQKFLGPTESLSASDADGKILKRNNCLFLDTTYTDRKISNILTVNRKIFDNYDDIFLTSDSWFFNTFRCERDTTLVSYYENGDYYKPHQDNSISTCLTWFFKSPKKFHGGNLSLLHGNSKIDIEVENNKCVIFPSNILHSVDQIIMNSEDLNKKLGRFCITQFFLN